MCNLHKYTFPLLLCLPENILVTVQWKNSTTTGTIAIALMCISAITVVAAASQDYLHD